MAYAQKLEVEVEVKCNAQKFWECLKDHVGFLKAGGREDFESLEILEGDGKSAGSIFVIKNKPGHPIPVTKQKVELVDEEKKTLSYSIIDGEMLQYFKNLKSTIVVIPKGEGSLVKSINEFTKLTDQLSDDLLRQRAVEFLRSIEKFLLKA